MVTENELLEMMYDALRAEVGLEISTDDPERLRQKFYALRKGHEELSALSFIQSPYDAKKLWIAHPPNKE